MSLIGLSVGTVGSGRAHGAQVPAGGPARCHARVFISMHQCGKGETEKWHIHEGTGMQRYNIQIAGIHIYMNQRKLNAGIALRSEEPIALRSEEPQTCGVHQGHAQKPTRGY